MRVTYQLGANFVAALKGAMERQAADEVGVSVNVNPGEVSELSFSGVQNPSQYIREFAALYGIDGPLRVKAIGRGEYSAELEENRAAALVEDDSPTAAPRRKSRGREEDARALHDNLFESAGSDAVDQDLYAVFG